MKYQAFASKGGDQAIIITGGPNPLIIPTNFGHLNNLQAMAGAINSILEELQPASTQPGWFPTDAELEEEARLMAPNVRINLTLPQGHPERQKPVEETQEIKWSFEACGSENDNALGDLLIGDNCDAIQLLAESAANLVRIFRAELKSHGFEPPTFEECINSIEREKGLYDPWSLQLEG